MTELGNETGESVEGPREPASGRFGIVPIMSVLTALLGVVMIVKALAAGGGLGSYGVLVGAFFVAAGVMRFRFLQARRRAGR